MTRYEVIHFLGDTSIPENVLERPSEAVSHLRGIVGHFTEAEQKFKATTDSNRALDIAPNLLNWDFHADAPNQKWAGDISYVWTREGWLYLAIILDLHSRLVVGWAISNRMKRDLAIRALNMAIALRRPLKGCMHHSPTRAIRATQQLSREAGFPTIGKFINETSRNEIPFAPKRYGVENRYGVTDLALAIALRKLRDLGLPIARCADLLRRIDRQSLEVALHEMDDGRIEAVLICVPLNELDLLEETWTGVFTSRAAAAEAISESDVVVLDLGVLVSAIIGGEI